MRIPLDSHTVIGALDSPAQLSPRARDVLEAPDNDLLLGAGTIWELAIKSAMQKLSLSLSFREWMLNAIAELEVTILPITVDYANAQAQLPFHHRDPFDRLLVAQSQVENAPVVSNDAVFDHYGIVRLW